MKLYEIAKNDMAMVLAVDPGFHLPYLKRAEELENEGKYMEAEKIRKFVDSLFS
jgi:hypothetical protein